MARSGNIPSISTVRELLGLQPLTADGYDESLWVRDKNGQWVAYVGLSVEEMWVTDPVTGQETPQFSYGDIYSSNIDTTPDYKARVASPTLSDGTVVFETGNSVNDLGRTEPPPQSTYDDLPRELPTELAAGETAYVRANPDTFELDTQEEQARATLDTEEEQPPPPAPVEEEQPPPPSGSLSRRVEVEFPDGRTVGWNSKSKRVITHAVVVRKTQERVEAEQERYRTSLEDYVASGRWTRKQADESIARETERLSGLVGWTIWSTHQSKTLADKGVDKVPRNRVDEIRVVPVRDPLGEEEQPAPPPAPAPRKRSPAKKAPAKKAAAKKATPAKRTPAKKTAAKKTAAAPVGPNIGRYRNIRDQETAAKAAAAQAEQVERQHQLATASLKLAKDNLAAAQANPNAEPHLKTEAQAAVGRSAAVKRAADKARQDAKASAAAAGNAGSLDEALNHALAARDAWMRSQDVAADAKQIERDVLTSAKAEPRPAFKNAAAKRVFLNPPETHRPATPQEERSVLGNAKEWAGLWVAKNADDYRPLIKIRPTGGLRAMYSPEHHLAAERRKWAKVELVRRVAPALERKLAATANGIGITGTPLQRKTTLDNAAAARLVMQTGMRAGNPGNESTIKNARGQTVTVPTYGATTLRAEHVESVNRRADGTPTSMYLKFYGKSGVLNRIKVTDPETIEDILRRKEEALERKRKQTAKQRRENPDDELFPNATASAAGDMVNEYTQEALREAGIAAEVADDFGVSDEDDPMSDVTFSLRTLRTLHANALTAEILSKMIARRKPRNREEFIEYMEQATEKAAAILGNQHATFKLNYLSALPFLQWMPEGVDENGDPLWEDWWVWGAKTRDKPA